MSTPEPRRDQGLEVAIARVGRPGPRGRWVAIVWTAVLVAAVAMAIGGRATEPGPPPVVVPVAVAVIGPHADPGPQAWPTARWPPIRLVAVPPERTLGEDGMMGSLGFDLEPVRVVVRRWPVGRLPGWTNPTQS